MCACLCLQCTLRTKHWTKPKAKTRKTFGVTNGIFVYILSDLCLELSSVNWNWLTKFSHCVHIFSVIILAEYSSSMMSVNLTVYRLVFRMSVPFTILVKFQINRNLPLFISLFSPDKFACIFTYDYFKIFISNLPLKRRSE